MKFEKLLKEHADQVYSGKCPDCGGGLLIGPTAGLIANVKCKVCGAKFNIMDPRDKSLGIQRLPRDRDPRHGQMGIMEHRAHLLGLIDALQKESRIIKGHTDPDSYNNCWRFLREDLCVAIEEIQDEARDKAFEGHDHELSIHEHQDGTLTVRCVTHGENVKFIGRARRWKRTKSINGILKEFCGKITVPGDHGKV